MATAETQAAATTGATFPPGDRKRAARCARYLSEAKRFLSRFDEAQADIDDAIAEFKSLGDDVEVATCQSWLSDLLHQTGKLEEAVTVARSARETFARRGMDWDGPIKMSFLPK